MLGKQEQLAALEHYLAGIHSCSPLSCCSCRSWCEWLWSRTPSPSSQWLPRLSLWARWQQRSVVAPSKDPVSPCLVPSLLLVCPLSWSGVTGSSGPPHTSRSDVIFQTKRRDLIQFKSFLTFQDVPVTQGTCRFPTTPANYSPNDPSCVYPYQFPFDFLNCVFVFPVASGHKR